MNVLEYLDQTPRTPQQAAIDLAKAALQKIALSSTDINSQDYALEALLRMRTDPEPIGIARLSLKRLTTSSEDEESRERAAETLIRVETLLGGGR